MRKFFDGVVFLHKWNVDNRLTDIMEETTKMGS